MVTPKKKPVSKKRIHGTRGRLVEKNPILLHEKGQAYKHLYIAWCAIPASLRLLPEAELKKMGFDVDDEDFMKLVRIRTKKEFCEVFGLNKNMPSRWNKDPEVVDEINKRAERSYVMKFKKDVDFMFTQKVLKHGDANRMKLWKQLYEGWNERTESLNVNVQMTPADLVAEIEKRNAELRAGDK